MSRTQNRIRAYRSDLRQQQAAETRQRVVRAAIEVFGEKGYQTTTLAQLADRAGVSVETVQKHGPKSALMWAAVELASFGVEGEADILHTDIGQAVLATSGPEQFAALVGGSMLAINEPSAAIWTSFTGAASAEPELRIQLHGRLASIKAQVERVLGVVADRGWLRTDVPIDELVEAFCVVTSVESYVRFVHLDGQSAEQYSAFVTRSVRDLLLSR